MAQEQTSAAVERYLQALDGDPHAEPIVRALLERAIRRLQMLCGAMLHRRYPRLTRPPMNVQSEELLSAVVERLLKAMREARPKTTRQFFSLANQHMRWELNDLARRLDEQEPAAELNEELIPGLDSSGSGISPDARRMLAAIDGLPDDEREVFGLVRIQGLSQSEAADLLGVSAKTIQRRLNRGLLLLGQVLSDLRPDE
jgi:RNA polymerase sigma factor (sigma-70 family)